LLSSLLLLLEVVVVVVEGFVVLLVVTWLLIESGCIARRSDMRMNLQRGEAVGPTKLTRMFKLWITYVLKGFYLIITNLGCDIFFVDRDGRANFLPSGIRRVSSDCSFGFTNSGGACQNSRRVQRPECLYVRRSLMQGPPAAYCGFVDCHRCELAGAGLDIKKNSHFVHV
jgi:hypothetical protein